MSFAIALATDLIAIFVLAYVLYFRRHRRRDLLLSYVALNIGVVAVTSALGSVEVGVGLGMGLFGILSIIRLRPTRSRSRRSPTTSRPWRWVCLPVCTRARCG